MDIRNLKCTPADNQNMDLHGSRVDKCKHRYYIPRSIHKVLDCKDL